MQVCDVENGTTLYKMQIDEIWNYPPGVRAVALRRMRNHRGVTLRMHKFRRKEMKVYTALTESGLHIDGLYTDVDERSLSF